MTVYTKPLKEHEELAQFDKNTTVTKPRRRGISRIPDYASIQHSVRVHKLIRWFLFPLDLDSRSFCIHSFGLLKVGSGPND